MPAQSTNGLLTPHPSGGFASPIIILLSVLALTGVGATVPRDALETLRRMPIQHNGRVKPFDSFARETLDRLTGAPQFEKQDPVVTLLSIVADPERWQETPLIAVPFVPLREKLGLPPKISHISYNQIVSERKLMRMLPAIVEKQGRDEKLSMLENETMDVYDRFVTLNGLFQSDVHVIPPIEGAVWLSIRHLQGVSDQKQKVLQESWDALLVSIRQPDLSALERSADQFTQTAAQVNPSVWPRCWRLDLEVFYNRFAPFRIARIFYSAAAFLLLWWSIKKGSRFLSVAAVRGNRTTGLSLVAGGIFLAAAFALHFSGILMRVILGGRPPVSNFYETMLWLPFVGVCLALIFERRYRSGIFGFAASLLAAIVLLLADHLPLDSSISPVVAVLRSNLWLTIHVLTIVGSYAPIALAAVLAHLYGFLYFTRGAQEPLLESLGTFIYRSLQVAVVLLTSGIMLGAVWANASWGRYWGWDPKETWALITLLWYLSVLHGRFAGWLKGIGVALCTIVGFFLVLMTYYGVSFYLVGLHSYAGGNAKPFPPLLVAYLVAEAAFIILVGWKACYTGKGARLKAWHPY